MCIQKRARESRPIIMKAVTAVVLLLPLAAASASPQRSRGRKGKVEDSSTKTWGRPNGEKQHGKHAAAFFCSLHCFDGEKFYDGEENATHLLHFCWAEKAETEAAAKGLSWASRGGPSSKKESLREELFTPQRAKQAPPTLAFFVKSESLMIIMICSSSWLSIPDFFSPFGFPIKIRVKLICLEITKNLCVSVQYYWFPLHWF